MFELSNTNLELLITIIEEQPVIQDKTSNIYKDQNLTRDVWKEICLAFFENLNNKSEKDNLYQSLKN